jgi:TonB family protein
MPPPTATNAKALKIDRLPIDSDLASRYLVRKQVPTYPQDAREARVSGTVVLRAIIGTDGGVHDLHVESTPWPSLASSALWAVSQWEYKPFLHYGDPVEVETPIYVIFTLGN